MNLHDSFPIASIDRLFPRPEGFGFTRLATHRHGEQVIFNLTKSTSHIDTKNVGEFKITTIPGNSSVLVFHASKIELEFQGQGIGQKLHELRLDWAKAYGATMLLTTTLSNNEAQNAIMNHFEWTPAAKNKNPRTGNEFTLWLKVMPNPVVQEEVVINEQVRIPAPDPVHEEASSPEALNALPGAAPDPAQPASPASPASPAAPAASQSSEGPEALTE